MLSSKNFQVQFDQQRLKPLQWVLGTLIGIAAVLVIFQVVKDYGFIELKSDLAKEGSSIFIKYLFLIVAVERAAAVFVGIRRDANRADWETRLKRMKNLLNVEDQKKIDIENLERSYQREKKIIDTMDEAGLISIELDEVPENNPSKEDYISYLTMVRDLYQFRLNEYNALTNRYVTNLVFFVGLFMAVIGISILSDILDENSITSLGKVQKGAVYLADIVITGGLLGGGSKSFNVFVNTIDEYVRKPTG